jgi:hypothetical protein
LYDPYSHALAINYFISNGDVGGFIVFDVVDACSCVRNCSKLRIERAIRAPIKPGRIALFLLNFK